jgi:hypothetical protein
MNLLTIEANEGIEKVVIYNVLGQNILTKIEKNTRITVQTNEMQKGYYIIKTTICGKDSYTKFSKEK